MIDIYRYDIVDHLGVVVAKLEYVGRSRCAWCTKIDQSQAFYVDYSDPESGPQEEPCCNACSMKGWSECVTMWDKKGAYLMNLWRYVGLINMYDLCAYILRSAASVLTY